MTGTDLPMQLSVLALRASPLTVAPGTPVLVVDNPRLVEAAAEQRLAAAVLCTNGNPTTAPSLAIAQLRSCGARLRYHGDFDAPPRPQHLGIRPSPSRSTSIAQSFTRSGSWTTSSPLTQPVF